MLSCHWLTIVSYSSRLAMRVLKRSLLVYVLVLVIFILVVWWRQGDDQLYSTPESDNHEPSLRDSVVEAQAFTVISEAGKNQHPLQEQHVSLEHSQLNPKQERTPSSQSMTLYQNLRQQRTHNPPATTPT